MAEQFSDFIVYADESGDHGLDKIDPQFPVFSLVFCAFAKKHYRDVCIPAAQSVKHRWFGHDAVVFHEREIRKQLPPFDFLMGPATIRDSFFADIGDMMNVAEFRWFASVIMKEELRKRYATPWNPYQVAMHFCLEKLWYFLRDNEQDGKRVHVLFESRGKNEDRDLELEFRRVVSNQSHWGWRSINFTRFSFEPVFVSKAANCTGHQITDMIARPIALHALRPTQDNRAYKAIENRRGWFKVFP